jgi:hypothetical protein
MENEKRVENKLNELHRNHSNQQKEIQLIEQKNIDKYYFNLIKFLFYGYKKT